MFKLILFLYEYYCLKITSVDGILTLIFHIMNELMQLNLTAENVTKIICSVS